MGFKRRTEISLRKNSNECSCNKKFEPFVGLEVIDVTHVGETWNDHGFEISFKDLPDKH